MFRHPYFLFPHYNYDKERTKTCFIGCYYNNYYTYTIKKRENRFLIKNLPTISLPNYGYLDV